MKTLIQAAVVTLFASSAAQAQQAVQWQVSDGGNGHWYSRVESTESWNWHESNCRALGGHLATVTSSAEQAFVGKLNGVSNTWIGGYQVPNSCEPGCGWVWVTGELWSYENWDSWAPDNYYPNDNYLHVDTNNNRWNDQVEDSNYPAILEWDSDCNADGIVDYGQCQDGTLPDYNGNNIPDCCEVPAGWVVVADSVADYATTQGANGWHYMYDTGVGTSVVPMAYVVPSGFSPFMPAWCTRPEFGGNGSYCSIDQIQCHTSTPSHCSSASAGLERPHRRWINPSAVKGRVLITGYFGASDGYTARLQVFADGQLVFEQVASPAATPDNPTPIGAVVELPPTSVVDVVVDPNDGSCHADRVEYSIRVIGADCNGDGIVDYGQIMNGQLGDLNSDGIPDICQQPTCADADLFANGLINGADLGILLSEWGPANPSTVSDITRDGVVDGADLGVLLSFWGACP